LLLLAFGGILRAQTLPLPARPFDARPGSEVAKSVAPLGLDQREKEITAEILQGNVPTFLRRLCPVSVTVASGTKTNYATFYVTPDYLAVGSDSDYFLVPLSPATAQRIADALKCSLPTRQMVDAIYRAAEVKLAPSPIPPSDAMTTVAVFSNHNETVRLQRAEQLKDHPLGALVAGHEKDVVITPRLVQTPGKVAIYGWHRTNGIPIQPLDVGHADTWVDYSQCVRLVQQKMLLNGRLKTVADILADEATCSALSDEGAIFSPRYPTKPE
jgi:hypothetical protein